MPFCVAGTVNGPHMLNVVSKAVCFSCLLTCTLQYAMEDGVSGRIGASALEAATGTGNQEMEQS